MLAGEAARLATPAGCLLCDEQRRPGPPATVAAVPGAAAWCPWWSGTAYEMLVAPRRHRPRFEAAGDELAPVARVLRAALACLARALDDPPYNLALHTLPPPAGADFHWHVHIWPRLQRDGGFERGTGVLVTTVDPEAAAARLRAVGDRPG